MSPRTANKFRAKKAKAPPDYSAFGKNTVAVGLPSDVIHNPSDLPLSELGAIHEFGSSDGRIPARAPLKKFLFNNRSDIKSLLLTGARRVSRGASAMAELEKLAIWAQGRARESYVAVSEPPNAPSVVKRKEKLGGTANPLIDTGEMSPSVIGQVQKNDQG